MSRQPLHFDRVLPPSDSYWIGLSREQLSQRIAEELPRMRASAEIKPTARMEQSAVERHRMAKWAANRLPVFDAEVLS